MVARFFLCFLPGSILLQRYQQAIGQACQIVWRQLNLKATFSGADEHRREVMGGTVDKRSEPFFLAQRADTTQHITGGFLNQLFVRHDGFLCPGCPCDLLETQHGGDRYDADRQLLVIQAHHERLEYALRRYTHFRRGFTTVTLGRWVVVVLMYGVVHFGSFGRENSRGHAGSRIDRWSAELKHALPVTSSLWQHRPVTGNFPQSGIENGEIAELQKHRLALMRPQEYPVVFLQWHPGGQVKHLLITGPSEHRVGCQPRR